MDIKVGTLNCHRQTKFTSQKQLYIEDFIKSNNLDILYFQETGRARKGKNQDTKIHTTLVL